MLTRIKQENQSLIADGIEPNDLSSIEPAYYSGEKDGELNIEPKLPELWEYWRGYSYGNREFWLKKKNIELPNEF